jgi:predicted signal transduction protein with EAL and GGDEF domain
VRPQIVGALVPAKGKDTKELKKRAEATTLYHAQKLMKTIAMLDEQY